MGPDVEVPDFQSLMLPLLELADVKEWHVGAAVDELAERLRLTRLMIRFEVGCRVEEQMAIKRIDEDFFEA